MNTAGSQMVVSDVSDKLVVSASPHFRNAQAVLHNLIDLEKWWIHVKLGWAVKLPREFYFVNVIYEHFSTRPISARPFCKIGDKGFASDIEINGTDVDWSVGGQYPNLYCIPPTSYNPHLSYPSDTQSSTRHLGLLPVTPVDGYRPNDGVQQFKQNGGVLRGVGFQITQDLFYKFSSDLATAQEQLESLVKKELHLSPGESVNVLQAYFARAPGNRLPVPRYEIPEVDYRWAGDLAWERPRRVGALFQVQGRWALYITAAIAVVLFILQFRRGLGRRLAACGRRLAAPRKRLAESESRWIAAERRVVTVESRLAESESETKAARTRAVTAETRLAESERRMVTAETRLAESEKRMVTVESRLAESESETKAAGTRAVTYQEKAVAYKSRAVAFESRAVAFESRTVRLQDITADSQRRVVAAESRTAELEQHTSEMATKLRLLRGIVNSRDGHNGRPRSVILLPEVPLAGLAAAEE